MDVLGIEIKEGSWTVLHLRKTLLGVKTGKPQAVTGGDDRARLSELKRLISREGIKAPKIGIALPRSASISRAVAMPACGRESLVSIMGFEAERHIPYPPGQAYTAFRVFENSGEERPSALIAAVKKTSLDKLAKSFLDEGLGAVFIGAWHPSVLAALEYLEILEEKKITVLVGERSGKAEVDAFDGGIPFYSAVIEECKREAVQGALRAIRSISPKKRAVRVIDCANGQMEAFIQRPCIELSFSTASWDAEALCALGAALGASGGGQMNFIGKASKRPVGRTGILAASVLAASVCLALSYPIRDFLAVRALGAEVSGLEARTRELRESSDSARRMDSRIKALERIEKGGAELELLLELTRAMPDDAWLNSLEYRDGALLLEGYSADASSLLLKLGISKAVKDVELDGTVMKDTSHGERFRIKATANGAKGRV